MSVWFVKVDKTLWHKFRTQKKEKKRKVQVSGFLPATIQPKLLVSPRLCTVRPVGAESSLSPSPLQTCSWRPSSGRRCWRGTGSWSRACSRCTATTRSSCRRSRYSETPCLMSVALSDSLCPRPKSSVAPSRAAVGPDWTVGFF